MTDHERETTAIVVVEGRHAADGGEPAVVATWPFDHADEPCLGDVDRLARLQLAAMRMGLRVRVVHPTEALVSLLRCVGLSELIGPD